MVRNQIYSRFEQLEKKRVEPGVNSYIWSIFGYLGNIFFKRSPPDVRSGGGLRLLNLGSGDGKKDGFTNADFYRLHRLFSSRSVDWMVDLTKSLKCKNNYWDGVLIEHVNEHLRYTDNYKLFEELFRVIKPGGTLRVVVPDLDKYLSWSEVRLKEAKMQRYHSLAEAVSNLTQSHAHISTWNGELLREVLEAVGFVGVTISSYGEGALTELACDSEKHPWQSLYMEATKP